MNPEQGWTPNDTWLVCLIILLVALICIGINTAVTLMIG